MLIALGLLLAGGFPAQEPDSAWTPVLEEEFSDETWKDRWRLEGFADLSLGEEGDARFLKILTRTGDGKKDESVLWYREPVRGDLRFLFRARAEDKNRSIFLFNANPTAASGLKSIFDVPREDAQYVRYAGTETIEMYSIGILRSDEKRCNLRYLGGGAVKTPNLPNKLHSPVISSHPSPYEGKPDAWFEFDLRVEGKKITFRVNGKVVAEVEDPGRSEALGTAWTPLTNGGHFGFRNFQPNTACIDSVRVYRKAKP